MGGLHPFSQAKDVQIPLGHQQKGDNAQKKIYDEHGRVSSNGFYVQGIEQMRKKSEQAVVVKRGIVNCRPENNREK